MVWAVDFYVHGVEVFEGGEVDVCFLVVLELELEFCHEGALDCLEMECLASD